MTPASTALLIDEHRSRRSRCRRPAPLTCRCCGGGRAAHGGLGQQSRRSGGASSCTELESRRPWGLCRVSKTTGVRSRTRCVAGGAMGVRPKDHSGRALASRSQPQRLAPAKQHIYQTAHIPNSAYTKQHIYQTAHLPNSACTKQHIYQAYHRPCVE